MAWLPSLRSYFGTVLWTVFDTIVDAVFNAGMIVLPPAFRSNSLRMLLRPDIMFSFGRMLGGVSVACLISSDEVRFSAAVDFNAWCELAKSLKRKGGFPDTQTESRLVQRITPLFSTTAFQ